MGITTVEGAIRHLEEVEDLLNNPNSPIFKDISTQLQSSLLANFAEEGRPKWMARMPVQRGEPDYPWPMLQKTGFLRDSTEASLNYWEHSGDQHTVEAWSPEYGSYHQYGAEMIRERKYMKLTEKERQEILESISQIIRDTVW